MINNDKVNIIFLRVAVNFVAPICEDISGDTRIDECTYRRSLFLVERVDISISEISPSGRSSAFVLLSYHFSYARSSLRRKRNKLTARMTDSLEHIWHVFWLRQVNFERKNKGKKTKTLD